MSKLYTTLSRKNYYMYQWQIYFLTISCCKLCFGAQLPLTTSALQLNIMKIPMTASAWDASFLSIKMWWLAHENETHKSLTQSRTKTGILVILFAFCCQEPFVWVISVLQLKQKQYLYNYLSDFPPPYSMPIYLPICLSICPANLAHIVSVTQRDRRHRTTRVDPIVSGI